MRRMGAGTGPWLAAALLVAGAAIPASPSPAAAQGYRGEVRLFGGFLELRPLSRDSLPEADVPGTRLRRRLEDGTVVACTPGEFCRWFSPGEVESISVLTEELRLVGWPGLQGLSAHVHLRGRFGTDDFWPRSEQELEALTAYLNYDAGEYRVRAGRQYRIDGLGYYNFDGASLLWRGFAPLRIEAYGGWSLGRGLNAPRSGDLLVEADEFAPDDRGFIVGAEVGGYWGRRLSATLGYQREIRTDFDALYTERLAFDARGLLEGVTLDASVEYDIAYDEVNEARLRAYAPVGRGVRVSAQARHHAPFFELWTIWGAFSPVGFNEGSLSVFWTTPWPGLSLEAGGGYRSYEETDAGTDFTPVREDGWRVFGDARWTEGPWFAGGGYRAEIGFGAARLGGDVRFGHTFDRGTHLAVKGMSTQTIGEFRIGEQRISGGAVEGSLKLGEFDLLASFGLYQLEFENRPRSPDWTQARAHVGLSYRFGTELGAGRDGGESDR